MSEKSFLHTIITSWRREPAMQRVLSLGGAVLLLLVIIPMFIVVMMNWESAQRLWGEGICERRRLARGYRDEQASCDDGVLREIRYGCGCHR